MLSPGSSRMLSCTLNTLVLGNLIFGGLYHSLGDKSEFPHQVGPKRRAAKSMHANDHSAGPNITVPADDAAGFDRDSRAYARWKNVVAISLILLFEGFPAWHAHDPRSNSFLGELFVSRNAQMHFAAAGDEDHRGRAILRAGHDIGAARNTDGGGVTAAVEGRQLLPAEHQASRPIGQRHHDFIGLAHLIGVGRP